MLVAILGTTISPYLFFWQASQEIEEGKAAGLRSVEARKGASPQELQTRQIDVGVGSFFSNLVMYFIILTTAITLHSHGITKIETSRQAAEALDHSRASSRLPCSPLELLASDSLPFQHWLDLLHMHLLRHSSGVKVWIRA